MNRWIKSPVSCCAAIWISWEGLKLILMKRLETLGISLVLVLCASGTLCQQRTTPVYQDANAPISERIQDLIDRMTLEEKIAQLESGMNVPGFPGSSAP